MSKFLVTKKHYGDSNAKFIVGKQVLEIDDINKKRFSTIKKHFKTFIDIAFDSCGGNNIESIKLALGDTFSDLPIPIKSQHIFLGWFTSASGGNQITSDTLVSLDINTLYAQWEEVQIASDCTSYSVTTASLYKNTGIYTASIADSSQPIYIDWGDGTVEKLTSSISQKCHTYKTDGNFTVKISDNITSFAPSYNNGAWFGKEISQNRYTFIGMLTTGSKVTSLPAYAFYNCLAIPNIDFMQTCWPTVTSLPNHCFYYCSSLSSIQGAKRFTSLGQYCFYCCTGLTGIQDLSEFKFTALPDSHIFASCTNVTQWILPSGFTGTVFGNHMFYKNTKLSSLVLPNSLTSTGTYIFQNCSNLSNIIIPSKIQSIDSYAFHGCTSLSNVNIEATNLTAINQDAFCNCNKLTDLDLPDTVKTIKKYAFYGCTSLNYVGRKVEIEIPDEPEVDYLCFTAEEAGSTIKMSKSGSAPTVYLETSPTGKDGSWSDFTVDSTEINLTNVGDKVYFRAKQDNERFINENYEYNYFVMTGKIAASGNLNTLLKADGSVIDLTGRDYCYQNMFYGCTSLTQAPELPATTLAYSCYDHMFSGCTSLTQAPELPATTLATYCYYSMFDGCTSLTQAPELPATTLADWCYAFMFEGCTSLTQAPELPATDLTDCCYHFMFSGCTSLAQAPELPAQTLAGGCYAEMFISCKSPFTFSDKTFDEMIDLIQNEYIIGSSGWYNENEEPNNPIEIICSDKIMLATFDENEYTWTLTEK